MMPRMTSGTRGFDAMSIDEAIYFEAHEEELREMWLDYLTDNGLSADEFTLADFRREW